ncbi:MAG: hypothetical protein Q8P59_05605 [Dehalococcoidia bacterium]|nr:hypothetical protein [Dehalococcoidia bacterium]
MSLPETATSGILRRATTKQSRQSRQPSAWQLLKPIARKLADPKTRQRFEQDFLRALAAYVVWQLEERNQRQGRKPAHRRQPIDLGELPKFVFSQGRKRPSLSYLVLGQACLLLRQRGAKELQALLEDGPAQRLFTAAGNRPPEKG